MKVFLQALISEVYEIRSVAACLCCFVASFIFLLAARSSSASLTVSRLSIPATTNMLEVRVGGTCLFPLEFKEIVEGSFSVNATFGEVVVRGGLVVNQLGQLSKAIFALTGNRTLLIEGVRNYQAKLQTVETGEVLLANRLPGPFQFQKEGEDYKLSFPPEIHVGSALDQIELRPRSKEVCDGYKALVQKTLQIFSKQGLVDVLPQSMGDLVQ